MLEDPSESDQLAAIYALDERLSAKRRKQRENKRNKKKMKGLELDAKSLSGPGITPDDGDLTKNVNFVALLEVDPHKTDGSSNINSTLLPIEVQSGDGSKVVEAYENVEREHTSVRSDCGINGGNYVYRTEEEEYEMIAESGLCPQLSAVVSPEARMKNAQRNEKNREQLADAPIVACVTDEQGGCIPKSLEVTEEINTSDGLRSTIGIDPGLGNTRGNPEIEQTEATVTEVEKVFDRRDGGDIAAEIVKNGYSTKAAETAQSLKLGSMEKEDNLMLRKLLRKPRYYDIRSSSLQMCHICGEDDHKAAQCTMVRRKKPCYICGGFRHPAKRCNQGRECFKCGGRGHLARNCLEEPSSNTITEFCLRCGDFGHHMFICRGDYSTEDLKVIQCYVCKEFGHLCCGFKYGGQTVESCYKCGQSGHLGSECTSQEKRNRAQAKSFCDHEVKGQFAGKNGEHNKAGQGTPESTIVERSLSDNEIIPNFAHAPLKSGKANQVTKNKGPVVL